MNEQNSYYAFISYNSADEKWAKWLQHNLEYYHIPSALCKEYPELPKKIRPVFWYKQDLSGTKLKKALNNELSSSKYLIVICSPDSAKADWVNDEVVTFIEQGKGDRIIPFIVAGTPHAKNPDEECFPPALRNLNRDEEIRGIDVRRKEGKSHALVDVIATMFGVRFDVLWQRHERRRKKIRNIWIAIASIFLLCALGIYDYNRTKVEYYADFVDRWGVAEGIIPLDDDQVSHRHHSYKFEYTRVPFGENDFYSWRLKRVRLVNSKGVISDYAPDHHAFFYPIQEFEYTDGYVTDIINRDTYKRVVMRYSVKDDYEHNTACLIDMEGKEKIQGSAYLDASTTSMMPDVNSNSTKSKIKRFHYTRNEDGYITKITYHANDGDDLTETAIGDNNNIYGKLFELDSLGRVTQISYINNEFNISADKTGVAYIKFKYTLFGDIGSMEILDLNGKPTLNEQKFAKRITTFDNYGNPIEEWHEGIEGQPCYNNQFIYKVKVSYSDLGFQEEIKYIDFNGNKSFNSSNYAIKKNEYDAKGRCIKSSYYDMNEEPCFTANNYSIEKFDYNTEDCIINISFFDIKDEPCADNVLGVHRMHYTYNEHNVLIVQECYNSKNKPTLSHNFGIAKEVLVYNNYQQLVSVQSYNEQDKLCLDTHTFVCESKFSYDSRGNKTKVECYDSDGKLCISKLGYATISYKYDIHGNLVEERYMGLNGEPVYINGYTMVQLNYTKNGLISERRFYDENESLCLNDQWYAIERCEYDINGNIISVKYFNTENSPCLIREGLYSCLNLSYDKNGNKVEESFLDENYQLSATTKGYARAVYEYDNKRRIIKCKYYDNLGNAAYFNGAHTLHYQYDINGCISTISYYDKNESLCENNYNYAVLRYKYNSKHQITAEEMLDSKLKPVNCTPESYSKVVFLRDDLGRELSRSYYNENGNACWCYKSEEFGIAKYCNIKKDYDNKGNVIKYSYYDTEGMPTDINGYATIDVEYDSLGRVVCRRYFDRHGKLSNGDWYNKAIEKYQYTNNLVSEIILYNTDESHYITIKMINDEKGNTISKEYRDSTNSLKSILIPGVTDTKCAKYIDYLNEHNLNYKREYYGENGSLNDNEDGFSILINKYDKKGRVITQELYDADEQPSSSKIQGWHKVVIEYNNFGTLHRISYYDTRNNPTNVNASLIGGGCMRIDSLDKMGNYISSKLYTAINGEIVEDIPKTSQIIMNAESNIVGSAIMMRVEFPGQFREKGYTGGYFILEWNEWNILKGIDEFVQVFNNSKDSEKQIVFISWVQINGQWQFGDIIKEKFSSEPLGVRIIDFGNDSSLTEIYQEYKRS